MAAGDTFQGSPIVINTNNTLSGMTGVRFNPNLGLIKPATDGRAVHCLVTVGTSAPALECSTLNIAQALALLASSGELPYLALTSLKWYHRKVDPNAPKFLATSVHEQYAAAAGTLFFAGLEATANEPAVMSLVALLTSSDGTDPVTASQVAPPTDPLTIAPYVLDSVTVDGTDVTNVASVSIRPSVQVDTKFGTKPYPRLARPRTVDWGITVRHRDATIIRSKGHKAGAIAVVLKALNTGGPTRGAGTQTWTVTGAITSDGDSGPGVGDSEIVTSVTGRHDGSNQPCTWSNS